MTTKQACFGVNFRVDLILFGEQVNWEVLTGLGEKFGLVRFSIDFY